MLRRRTQARILALQALCLYDALGDEFDDRLDVFLHDTVNHADAGIEVPASEEAISFARKLARGAWKQRGELDRQLNEVAPHWTTARMTPVDRNALRLGLYELLEVPENPPPVIINEALELVRRFSDTSSAHFVNGVLDHLRRRLDDAWQPAEPPPPVEPPTGPSGARKAEDVERLFAVNRAAESESDAEPDQHESRER